MTVSRTATTLLVTTRTSALMIIPLCGRTVSVRPVFTHKESNVVVVFIIETLPAFQNDNIRSVKDKK